MPYKNIEDRRAGGRRSAKKRREANREKFRKEAYEYYQANKEKIVEIRRARRKANPEQYEREKKNCSAAIIKKKREIKSRLVECFGGKCSICGIEDEDCIYDFHHRDPADKQTNIAELVNRTRNYEIALKEAQKCDLVCANCHRKIHKV